MTRVHSPTAGRRRVRLALRDARDAAALTQEQVAEAMDWSLSKVIRIETGAVSISTSDLRQLLLLYRVDDPGQVAELVELARIGRQKPWWVRFKDHSPPTYLSFVGLEDESTAQYCFTPFGMPGLLQTEKFAYALLEALVPPIQSGTPVPRLEPQTMTERVDLRMQRQREVLDRPNPPQIVTVLDEAVLWRQIGGTGVLRDQLRHLIELGNRPNLVIQVLPFTARRVTGLGHFVVLEFDDPADPAVVYFETAFEQAILDRPTEVTTYRTAFDLLRTSALAEKESLELIARVADELG